MINVEWLREYCLNKKEFSEDFPFDDEVLVLRVRGKIFALININQPQTINLKAHPDRVIELREQYEQVQPGWHMNKKHWNTVTGAGLTQQELAAMIHESYLAVVSGFPLKVRKEILG